MWFLHQRYQDYTELPNDASITPALILSQAKQGFMGTVLPREQHDTEKLWQAFLEINHTAVARYATNPFTPPKLAALALDAGASPPFSAVRTLYRLKLIRNKHLPSEFIQAFIRESAARLQRRTGTQAQLAAQLGAIQAPSITKNISRQDADSIYLITTRLSESPMTRLDWQQVLDLYPPSVAALTGRTPKRATKTTRQPKPARATRPELETIMAGPAHHVVVDALSNSLTVNTTPGYRVELRAWDHAKPLLSIEKQQDGVLAHSGAYTPDADLPDPSQPRRPEPRWNTRGLKSEAAARKVMAFLTNNWTALAPQPGTPMPRIEKVAHILHSLLAEDAARPQPRYTSDESLSEDLAEGLRSLVDPRIRGFTADMAPHTGPQRIQRRRLRNPRDHPAPRRQQPRRGHLAAQHRPPRPSPPTPGRGHKNRQG